MSRTDVHVHVHTDTAILDRLHTLESQMSALTDAAQALADQISALVVRIDQDVTHLQDLLSQALAASAADEAALAAIQAEADAVAASLAESTAALGAIDPVADFPAEEPPAEPVA